MNKPESGAGRVFYYFWYSLDLSRRVILNILFFIVLLFLLIGIFAGGDDKVLVPKGSALVLAPSGVITEEPVWVDPIEAALQDSLGNSAPKEESIHDIIAILDSAKNDDRITSLVIYPQGVVSVGPAMLEMFRDAVADFKESGKPVYSMSDFMGQPQYHMAVQADEVYMHPYGAVVIEGYSRIRTYHKSLFDNLRVTPNVFKVGKYKSAIEPYLLDGMSDNAKEANIAYLNDLWAAYKADIEKARGISPEQMDSIVNSFDEQMVEVGGDWAQIAVNNNMIDGVMSRPEFREFMIEKVGENRKGNSYKQIGHRDYWKAAKPMFDTVRPNRDRVAVIVAKGAILDGNQKEGSIGGNTLAAKIRKAHNQENTKAIVLRVDSPGGSAFASEIIREEIMTAKEKGIKFVVSMGTYAASGGYWISANADEIWARPTTITGSIGIFGFIPTFERTLDWAGVYRDGVGTTELAGALDPGKAMGQPIKDIIQANIENGYRRFLNLVSSGRNMEVDRVDQIAQGRVWSGVKALELGLVDKLGSLDQAVESAAVLAELEDGEWVKWFIKRELTQEEQLIKQLLDSESSQNILQARMDNKPSAVSAFVGQVQEQFERLQEFNDPNHAYVVCDCQVQ